MDEDPLATNALSEDSLLEEMQELWRESDAVWVECRNQLEFGGFVSADYVEIFQHLVQLQDRVTTFLEWGSGLGVVAIMASRLGYEAYGIEVEPLLIEHAQQLSERFGSEAEFAEGSFIPDDYQWGIEEVGNPSRTNFDTRAAYDDLDMELRDFDLVYAYPWPDEHGLYLDIMRTCGGEQALFLTFDAREGTSLRRVRDE